MVEVERKVTPRILSLKTTQPGNTALLRFPAEDFAIVVGVTVGEGSKCLKAAEPAWRRLTVAA
jgi:hypothetical protein